MLSTALNVGGTLLKRTAGQYTSSYTSAISALSPRSYDRETGENGQDVPVLAQLEVILNIIIFLPIITYTLYTLGCIYPTLAMVEDPLPAYEAIPISDDLTPNPTKKSSSTTKLPTNTLDLESASSSSAPSIPTTTKPITSSLRSTHSLLTSLSGFRSLFRGLPFLLFVVNPVTALGSAPVTLVLGPRIAHLFTLLIFCNLHAAWTHMIITPPSALPFWKRIPSYRRTFVATWLPTLVYWAALHSTVLIPYILAGAAGVTGISKNPNPNWNGVEGVYMMLILILALVMSVAVVVPAETALARVQASLLPDEEGADGTVVPFDRTFGGKVDPQSEYGRTFPTLKMAIGNVSRASWKRIVVQQLKVCGVSFAVFFGMGALLGLQAAAWGYYLN